MKLDEKLMVVENKVAQPVGTALVELVALHRGQHGAEDFRSQDVGEGVVAVLGEPEQQLAAGGMLADSRATVSLSCCILPSWMSKPASPWQTLAETLFSAVCSAVCQSQGAALKDSRARRCLEAGSSSNSGPSFASCAQIAGANFAFGAGNPATSRTSSRMKIPRARRPAACADGWRSRHSAWQ